jgi:hypothetical protein
MMSLREGCGGRDICMLQPAVQVDPDDVTVAHGDGGDFAEGGEVSRHFFPFNWLISFTSSGNG